MALRRLAAGRLAVPSLARRPLALRPLSTLIPGSSVELSPPPLDGGFYSFMRTVGKWEEVGDRPAVVCYATGSPRTITYAELPQRVSAAAHALSAAGFSRGDVVNLHLHNCEQFVVGYLAVAALGGTSTTSNPAYTAAELAGQQRDSGAKFCLSSRVYEPAVTPAAEASGAAVSYIEDEGCFANAAPTEAAPPPLTRPIDPATDVMTLPYSSGTTGVPKG
eukprot:951232-Prymnesium_polylepis.1